jgi:RNA polymerase sigma-70 factor (ECF subfamily)
MRFDDEHVLIDMAKKDSAVFGILFERHYPAIFSYVLRRVGNWEASKDITSEVFLKAFKGLWRYRWQNISFSSWLYRIATNEVRMSFRKARRPILSLDQLLEEIGFEPVDPETMQAERLEAERKLREYDDFLALRAQILELPIKYQDVITLRYFEQKSIKEIAEILHREEGTVKSLLSRGIGKLRNLL